MKTVSRQTGKPWDQEAATDLPPDSGQPAVQRMGEEYCAGIVTGSCGETIEVYLKVEKERVANTAFYTNGCHFSVLCGYLAAKLAIGKTVDEAAEIEGDTILGCVKGIPPNETHCAFLAASALHAAIHDWIVREKQTIKNQKVPAA